MSSNAENFPLDCRQDSGRGALALKTVAVEAILLLWRELVHAGGATGVSGLKIKDGRKPPFSPRNAHPRHERKAHCEKNRIGDPTQSPASRVPCRAIPAHHDGEQIVRKKLGLNTEKRPRRPAAGLRLCASGTATSAKRKAKTLERQSGFEPYAGFPPARAVVLYQSLRNRALGIVELPAAGPLPAMNSMGQSLWAESRHGIVSASSRENSCVCRP